MTSKSLIAGSDKICLQLQRWLPDSTTRGKPHSSQPCSATLNQNTSSSTSSILKSSIDDQRSKTGPSRFAHRARRHLGCFCSSLLTASPRTRGANAIAERKHHGAKWAAMTFQRSEISTATQTRKLNLATMTLCYTPCISSSQPRPAGWRLCFARRRANHPRKTLPVGYLCPLPSAQTRAKGKT